MREIKFRVWDKREKRMFVPGGLYLPNDGNLQNFGEGKYIHMQYTGLKDKNGVEIYEGDIVTSSTGETFKVVWENYSWQLEHPKEWAVTFSIGKPELEVIGNIYENPELLK